MDFVVGKKYQRNDGKFVECLEIDYNGHGYTRFEALEQEHNRCEIKNNEGWAYTLEGVWLSSNANDLLSLKVPFVVEGEEEVKEPEITLWAV